MVQEQRMPGVNCPRCKQFIPTSIMELLSAAFLRCPHCGLRMDIDRQKSKLALEALKKVNNAQREVEKRSHFNH